MDSDLRIEFNRPDRVYGQGETIRGHVIVGGDKGSRCRSVKLRSFWRARGKGTSDTGGTTDVTLHQGALEGMSPYEIPFEIVAPHGPFTYAGKTLQVEHHVSIHVDYSRAVDSEITEAFTLAPGIFVEPTRSGALLSRAREGSQGIRLSPGRWPLPVGRGLREPPLRPAPDASGGLRDLSRTMVGALVRTTRNGAGARGRKGRLAGHAPFLGVNPKAS